MLRTRDLVLFVLCLLVLFLAILVTLPTRSGGSLATIDFSEDAPTTEDATAPTTVTPDYASNIDRLKALIASGKVTVTPQPDTFLDDIPETETDVPVPPVQLAVSYCLYADDTLPFISVWPQQGTSLTVSGGTRVFAATETITPVGSTTPEQVVKQLLAMPVTPARLALPACVPSAIVGVTVSGAPIFNENASIWAGVAAGTLIGYARDGFPIYGRYDGEVDACGGYMAPDGYRYAVAANRSYVIGCYAAAPQRFSF